MTRELPQNPFPPHENALPNGLLCFGGQLSVELLLVAYRYGVFPWPYEQGPLAWFSPRRRAILFFKDLHVSHRLERTIRKGSFETSWNTHTKEIIAACARVHGASATGTWITDEMVQAYSEFADAGYCTSMATLIDGKLVGGVYGVLLDGVFAGESMFQEHSDASKVALVSLVRHLHSLGLTWLDCQVLNPLTKTFGAREVSRERYLKLLAAQHAASVCQTPRTERPERS